MADEIRISMGITIQKGNLKFRWPFPGAFLDDMATGKGPSPGYLDIPTTGRQIYFTELSNPHWCIIGNLESDGGNYFEVGIYDSTEREVYPMLKIDPGIFIVIPLSLNLGEEYAGSGTGTTEPTHYLHVRAGTPGPVPGSGGTVKGYVGAFEL
mgnify:CR=1 FL=1